MDARKILLIISSLYKSLSFNLHYLPFKQAVRLPIIVAGNVWLKNLGGQIRIDGAVSTAMIKIGFGEVSIFEVAKSRSIWDVSGTVVFKGCARIGRGSKIIVWHDAKLIFNDKFCISAESSIVCKKAITFGVDDLVSWGVLVMDTDFHKIKDMRGNRLNPDGEIIIGNHVWICCRCTILKNSAIGNNAVIGSGSIISKPIMEDNVLIAGHPAKIMRRDIAWEH